MKRIDAPGLPVDPDFFVAGYTVRFGTVAGPDGPRSHRRILQLVIRGRGWAAAAMPIVVKIGDVTVMLLKIERNGDLVCLLGHLPPEGASIVVQQWDRRAESPETFTRRKLPRGAQLAIQPRATS